MADPNADAYLVKDVADHGPGTWRWVYDHPVLRFFVPDVPRLKFAMDFAIPERTLRETGPVTLTFTVNGKLLDRLRCEQAGEQHYAHDVPRGNAARQRDQPGGHRSRPGVGLQGRWRQARVHPLPRRVHGVTCAAARDSLRRRVHLRGQPRAGRTAAAAMRAATRASGSSAARRCSVCWCACCAARDWRTRWCFWRSGWRCWRRGRLPIEDAGPRGAAGTSAVRPTMAMRMLWGIVFGLYVVLYLANAMAPEVSPDGAGYHLGLVARYLREHGFVRITDNLYAAMPAGVEMLFLFAFAFGRHSAAALVHFAFLLALVWQIFSYGRRRGIPGGGSGAALAGLRQPGGRHRRHQRLQRRGRGGDRLHALPPAADLGRRAQPALAGRDRAGRGIRLRGEVYRLAGGAVRRGVRAAEKPQGGAAGGGLRRA